jgi:GGDEF domain-containing protein
VESPGLRALVRLVNRRFGSFSEATDCVLGALEEVVPGTLLVAQMDPEAGRCRVIEVCRGTLGGVERGFTFPLARIDIGGNGPVWAVNGKPDAEFLRSLGLHAHISAPIEVAGGQIMGSLCAFAGDPDTYHPEHVALVGLGARLLSYERESTQTRAELRRLKARVFDQTDIDPETGLPNCERFLNSLEHTWGLVDRSLVEATMVTCHVPEIENGDPAAAAGHRLAIKDIAEVMGATIRETDHIGRVNGDTVGAILVGCPPQLADLFLQRFRSGLRRVTRSRREAVVVACGIHPLEGTASAADVLATADRPTEPFELVSNEAPVPESASP